jgi:hypothetical protein
MGQIDIGNIQTPGIPVDNGVDPFLRAVINDNDFKPVPAVILQRKSFQDQSDTVVIVIKRDNDRKIQIHADFPFNRPASDTDITEKD